MSSRKTATIESGAPAGYSHGRGSHIRYGWERLRLPVGDWRASSRLRFHHTVLQCWNSDRVLVIFTRALLGHGLRQDELILVECDPLFAGLLKHDYPDARIYQGAVERLRHINLLGKEQAGAVVSGLPLLSMAMRSRIAILQFAFRHLRPGGSYYQFTYGLRCPCRVPHWNDWD